MYKKILVALGNEKPDAPLLEHAGKLARMTNGELLLLHVADGWAARNYDHLQLAESEEIRADKAYLQNKAGELRAAGLQAGWHLAMGNPPQEIMRVARERACDLIMLATHGHKAVGDVIFGSTIDKVRHNTTIPLLIVYGGKPGIRPAAQAIPPHGATQTDATSQRRV